LERVDCDHRAHAATPTFVINWLRAVVSVTSTNVIKARLPLIERYRVSTHSKSVRDSHLV